MSPAARQAAKDAEKFIAISYYCHHSLYATTLALASGMSTTRTGSSTTAETTTVLLIAEVDVALQLQLQLQLELDSMHSLVGARETLLHGVAADGHGVHQLIVRPRTLVALATAT